MQNYNLFGPFPEYLCQFACGLKKVNQSVSEEPRFSTLTWPLGGFGQVT